MVDMKADLNEDLNTIPEDQLLLKSVNSLGQGIMDDIQDVIYVKTDGYSASNNQLIAYDIEKLNKRFLDEGKHYILVGPGRWGSSDTWLGIPVKWPNISAARVIVEAGLTNYRVDPSQGTHFFQNLTSFGVGYFTINAYMNDGLYNQELLNSMPAVEETKFLRWVHFDKPLTVKMDGKRNRCGLHGLIALYCGKTDRKITRRSLWQICSLFFLPVLFCTYPLFLYSSGLIPT